MLRAGLTPLGYGWGIAAWGCSRRSLRASDGALTAVDWVKLYADNGLHDDVADRWVLRGHQHHDHPAGLDRVYWWYA